MMDGIPDFQTIRTRTKQKIAATQRIHRERQRLQTLKIEASVASLCKLVDANTLRLLLASNQPNTQQDEQSLIHAIRHISTARTIHHILIDGNCWSSVPVSAGSIDWSRILDAIICSFGGTIKSIRLTNLPFEKVICVPDQDKLRHSFEPTLMYFESRLLAPILQLLHDNVCENVVNFSLKWAEAIVQSSCFINAHSRISIENVLKFNCTLRSLSIVSCNGGDVLAQRIASALSRSNNTLQELDLSDNGIAEEGCTALHNMLALGLCGLSLLRLDRNLIGDEGTCILAQSLPTCAAHFNTLSLNGCGVGNKGGQVLEHFCRLSAGKKNRWRPKAPSTGLKTLILANNPKLNEDTRSLLRSLLSIKGTAFRTLDLFVAEEIESIGSRDGGGHGNSGGEKSSYNQVSFNKKIMNDTQYGEDANDFREKEDAPISHRYDMATSSESGTFYGMYDEEEAKKIKQRGVKKFPLYSLSKRNY
jgi:hypothetical protein